MKKDFLTGLALLLPTALTLWIIALLIRLLTNPFLSFMEGILRYYDLLDHPYFFLTSEQVVTFWSRLIIMGIIIALILFIGFLGQMLFMNLLFNMGNRIVQRIPLINKMYNAFRDAVDTFFSQDGSAFSNVVLVPYPHKQALSIGFLAGTKAEDLNVHDTFPIFIPAAPNPTVGYLLRYKREQMIFLDMKVDDAMKIIVACGAMDGCIK